MSKTVVDIDGVLVSATGHGSKENVIVESESAEMVKAFHMNAEARLSVSIIHMAPSFTAGYNSPLEVAAALVQLSPGRAVIIETEPEVIEALDEAAGPQEPGIVY